MTSLDMIRGRQVIATLTNQSGGAIIAGDVVIVSAANDESFTTTTTASYNSTRVGVALDSIAAAATGRILLEGYAPLVNVSASATRGHYLLTHTVAKQATSQAGYAAGAFGQIIKAGTSPSAMIFPVAQVGSAGIGGSTGSTDNAVIRADGTGGSTAQSSLATVDDSGGINIPTGQTYNINGSPHTHGGSGMSEDFTEWSSDAPPASPTASDDEFADESAGVPTGWTEVDFGSVLTVAETEVGVEMTITTVATKHAGIYQAIPAGNGTWITRVDLLGIRANYFGGGITLWEDATSSSGDLISFRFDYGASGLSVNLQRWSDYQTWNENYMTALADLWLGHPNGCLRVRRTGTAYTFDVGIGKGGWLKILELSPLAITPTHIGPGVFMDNAGVTSKAVFYYWRYVASDVGITGVISGDRVGGHAH